ncbi:MAG TPA: endoglucanase [Treponema sp.]|nr:endoglucanase [Treponema sp.]HBD68687.1 endoglucanase [Treponema sp.]
MKHSKLLLTAAIIFVATLSMSSCSRKPKAFVEKRANGLAPSQHVKVPDTKSSVVTEDQPFDTSLTSVEVVRLMGNGINLSNTMEAYRSAEMSTTLDPSVYETSWGQPLTTQTTMDSYKAAGFDSVRIPVAWTNAMNYENGDYTINTAYLDRVEEIVNYALKADLYVIINDHWDGGWWGMFGSATLETREDAYELYRSMWQQIAKRFMHYGDHLLFAGGNEEIGRRLNDVNVCTDSGKLTDDECYQQAQKINQTFVDVVRKTGGNNKHRFLLIPGFGTDIGTTVDPRFIMPSDSAKDKLMIEVHYYSPWGFCSGNSVNKWGTQKEYRDMNEWLSKMDAFTQKGYGVVIGEWGVISTKKDGTKKDDMLAYCTNFLDICDIHNFSPQLWDTSLFFMRDGSGFADAELAQFFKERKNPQSADEQKAAIAEREANAPITFIDNSFVGASDKSVAWIMYNSQPFDIFYSVGDVYSPDSCTEGLVPTDVEITGEGDYTVALDFTGTAQGYARSFGFSAIGISNGELLFPGYCIQITEMRVNDEPVRMPSKGFTNADDRICTRMNIYNEWVNTVPEEARSYDGSTERKRAIIVNRDLPIFQEMKTLSITFHYGLPNS